MENTLHLSAWPETLEPTNDAVRIEPKDLSIGPEEYVAYYRDYCNRILWPLLHGCPPDPAATEDSFDAYLRINRKFARQTLARCGEHTRISISDYPLMLVPAMLRESAQLRCKVYFSLRAGFSAAFASLRSARALFAGMLGADVIELPGSGSVRAFHEYAREQGYGIDDGGHIVYDDRRVLIEIREGPSLVTPILAALQDEVVITEQERLHIAHKRIVLSVDQLTHGHGMIQRLLGFEELLSSDAGEYDNTTLLQIAASDYPLADSRADLVRSLDEIADRVNREHGTSNWKPIQLLYAPVGLQTLVALYKAADVLLLTRFTSGPYFVADEFIAAQEHSASRLIVSRQAAVHYPAAVHVDAHRPAQICTALKHLLADSAASAIAT